MEVNKGEIKMNLTEKVGRIMECVGVIGSILGVGYLILFVVGIFAGQHVSIVWLSPIGVLVLIGVVGTEMISNKRLFWLNTILLPVFVINLYYFLLGRTSLVIYCFIAVGYLLVFLLSMWRSKWKTKNGSVNGGDSS